jgi:hypothetical protein
MNAFLRSAAFAAGLAVLGWVALGYAGANPLALAITLVIAAFYIAGALELLRFQRGTAALAAAVAELPDTVSELAPWLARVPATLRNAVRRRVEGEPVGLPGPALAPYLAGLLVLLGMLGTFVGMILTLRGTGLALESTTDIAAVRDSLVAPVKGLGLAFGTSVAGVAASAALGLLATLCRRERAVVAQALDGRIATTLRAFSPAWQREQSLQLLQQQAAVMPALVDTLRTLAETLTLQSQAAHERLQAGQDAFHGKAESAYRALAGSVDKSLRESLAESARIAGEQIRPVAEATLAGIARETAALQATLADSAQAQSAALATRFEAIGAAMADGWQAALGRHEQASAGLAQGLDAALARSGEAQERRAAALLDELTQRHAAQQADTTQRHAALHGELATALQAVVDHAARTREAVATALGAQMEGLSAGLAATVDGLSSRLDATVDRVTAGWHDALAQQARAGEQVSQQAERALATAAGAFGEQARVLRAQVDGMAGRLDASVTTLSERLDATVQRVADGWEAAQAQQARTGEQLAQLNEQALVAAAGVLGEQARALNQETDAMAVRLDAAVSGLTDRLDATVQRVTDGWQETVARQARAGEQVTAHTERALVSATAAFGEQAQTLLQGVHAAHERLQAGSAAQDEQRLAAMARTLEAMAAALRDEWQRAGTQATEQQQRICDAMERSAREITRQAQDHAHATIAEIGRLVDAAAEAPRAAASVVAELRQKLSDSMARDNTLLEERARILDTLGTLLAGVQQAATEQRGAIDALVDSSARMLEGVGERFGQQVQAQTGQLAAVAAQVAGGAAEVASLGGAFGAGVLGFGESNDRLVAQLARIDDALGRSLARSDEQLEYYVAQAREVIDLSILSQKQIIEELQRLSAKAAIAG